MFVEIAFHCFVAVIEKAALENYVDQRPDPGPCPGLSQAPYWKSTSHTCFWRWGGFRALRKNTHRQGEDVQTLHKKAAIQTQKGLHFKLEMLLLRGNNTSVFIFSESKKKPSS